MDRILRWIASLALNYGDERAARTAPHSITYLQLGESNRTESNRIEQSSSYPSGTSKILKVTKEPITTICTQNYKLLVHMNSRVACLRGDSQIVSASTLPVVAFGAHR